MMRLLALIAFLAPAALGSDIGRQSPCHMSGAFVDCYQPVEHTSMEGPASPTVSGYLSSGDWAAFNTGGAGGVPATRTINTTAPIAGGGNLSANLTLSMPQSNAAANGYLGSTDWSTFNGKGGAYTQGNLTESTSAVLSFSGGTNAVFGSGTTIQVTKSDAAHPGYLASSDWAMFNGKDQARTVGNLTEATSAILTIGSGTGAVIGSGTTIQVTQSGAAANGYLGSTDWQQFNARVATTRTINTTAPLTGGGNLSADRTFAISASTAAGAAGSYAPGAQVGYTGGSAPTSGNIGQVISDKASSGAVATNTSTFTTVATVTLTAGLWLCSGTANVQNAATQTGADAEFCFEGTCGGTTGYDLLQIRAGANNGTAVTFPTVFETVATGDADKTWTVKVKSFTAAGTAMGTAYCVRIN